MEIRPKLRRSELILFFEKQEACGVAHHRAGPGPVQSWTRGETNRARGSHHPVGTKGRMIRFRRGGSVPGQPGHRTRTKRTDHELPKPALRAMGEVAVIGIRHGLLGIGRRAAE
jgi:hypothetical protein